MNFHHQYNIIHFDFINKFYFQNSINLPLLEKITLRSSILNSQYEQNSYFGKSIFLIELLSFQKAFSKNYRGFMKGRGQKKYSFNCLCSLRKNDLYNFLYFFIYNVLLDLNEYFLIINTTLLSNDYSFCIKDVAVFPGIAEYFIKWPFFLYLTFTLNKKNKFYMNLFLRNFSIFTEIK